MKVYKIYNLKLTLCLTFGFSVPIVAESSSHLY